MDTGDLGTLDPTPFSVRGRSDSNASEFGADRPELRDWTRVFDGFNTRPGLGPSPQRHEDSTPAVRRTDGI